jgi:ankyrin repeat protein
MFTRKKNLIATLFLLFFANNTLWTMEPQGDWRDPLMRILLGQHQTATLSQALDSSNMLSQQTRDTIKELAQKYLHAKAFDDAAHIIGALTELDDALKNKILHAGNFNSLVAYLAKRFNLKEKTVSEKITQYISEPSHESKQSKKKKKDKIQLIFTDPLQYGEQWARKVFTKIIERNTEQPEKFRQKLEENYEFHQLPEDIKKQIFLLTFQGYSATTLVEAINTIKALSLVNKQLNATINEPTFLLQLLENLAKKFNTDFLTVCNKFGTPQAKQYALQRRLFDLCFHHSPSKATLDALTIQGADLEFMYIYNDEEMTPLMISCCIGNNLMTKHLLEAGALINRQNTMGFSALMYCCVPSCSPLTSFSDQRKKFPHPIQLLLKDTSTDANLQNRDGDTALILAVKRGELPVVERLLAYPGINIRLVNNQNQSALDIAREKGNPFIIEYLERKLAQESSSSGSSSE